MGSSEVEIQVLLHNSGNGRSQEEIKTSIYKVPPLILNNKEKAYHYQPRVVSFGPYHHDEPHLRSMEAQKQHALQRFIRRLKRSKEDLLRSVRAVAEELKGSYDSLDTNWEGDGTEDFVELMVLDGCFMLEILQSNHKSDCDPVFSEHGDVYVLPLIRHDMLLLENQLPMLLLHRLNDIKNDKPDIENLNKDILSFLNYGNENYPNMGKRSHVLDLYRKSLLQTHDFQSPNEGAPQSQDGGCFHVRNHHHKSLPPPHDPQSPDEGAPQSRDGDRPKFSKCFYVPGHRRKGPLHRHNGHENAAPQGTNQGKEKWVGHNVVRPAMELHEAGVRFMTSKTKSLQDITFDDGLLELPNFIIDHYTKSMFLNLIAFERCHIHAGSNITSFVAFMDLIIDDKQDIKLLSSKGIIDNFVGTDKQAAELFNTISKDLVMEKNLYKVYTNLINYCNIPCHKWCANLWQTYFRSPWAIISVIAAFLILSLTAVQTIFTILN